MYGLKQTTPPTDLPLSLAEFKKHARIDHDEEDTYLLGVLIPAAVAWCEAATGRQLKPATWRLTRDHFPCSGESLLVPKPPLASVTSITYIDSQGDEQVWDDAEYLVDTDREPAEIRPAYGESWPASRNQQSAVVIVFEAGAAEVPAELKQAMLLVAAHWYANRESASSGVMIKAVEMSATALIDRFRVGDDFTNYGA